MTKFSKSMTCFLQIAVLYSYTFSYKSARFLDFSCIRKNVLVSWSTINSQPTESVIFHAAPMQCYTNRYLRYFFRLLNSRVTLWTEMQKVEDLLLEDAYSSRRLEFDDAEHPLVLQIGGNSLVKLRAAIKTSNIYNYDEINLNLGCPSVETGGSNYGAALMLNPSLVKELIQTLADATYTPLSIKCRIGAHSSLDEDKQNPVDDYENFYRFIEPLAATGAISHVVVHARSAILGGMSPSKNRCIPPLRHEFVHRLARDFPQLRVTLNGGIGNHTHLRHVIHSTFTSASHADNPSATSTSNSSSSIDLPHPPASRRIDGVMAGRWLLARPLDLSLIDTFSEIGTSHYTPKSRVHNPALSLSPAVAIVKYGEFAAAALARKEGDRSDILMPLLLVAEQLDDDYEQILNDDGREPFPCATENELRGNYQAVVEALRRIVLNVNNFDKHLLDVLSVDDYLETRKLCNIISQIIGKKVAHKLARNRKEALGV